MHEQVFSVLARNVTLLYSLFDYYAAYYEDDLAPAAVTAGVHDETAAVPAALSKRLSSQSITAAAPTAETADETAGSSHPSAAPPFSSAVCTGATSRVQRVAFLAWLQDCRLLDDKSPYANPATLGAMFAASSAEGGLNRQVKPPYRA